MTLTCTGCGVGFKARHRRMYCTKACFTAQKVTESACPTCGKVFRWHKSWPRIYCSRACSATANRKRQLGVHAGTDAPEVVCDVCRKTFRRWNSELRKVAHRFCSQACYAVFQSAERTGVARPDLTKRTPAQQVAHAYYGINWPGQSRNARRRDGYQCQACGAKESELADSLEVHHLIAFKAFGMARYREANVLANLISLCKSCHTKRHHADRRAAKAAAASISA